MSKVSYMAISYKCNQRCLYCPCSKEDYLKPFIPVETLKHLVDEMIDRQGADTIVLSGGEPTIHPDFLDFLNFLGKKNVAISILSNGEHFFNEDFFESFCQVASKNQVTVTTTLHSHKEEQHENANQKKGSFLRTIQGLLNLINSGYRVIIKHCITRENHRDLLDFYKFVNSTFPESANMQFCSIDYCGMEDDRSIINQEKITFPEIKTYLEPMFDAYLEDKNKGSQRVVYCINMPLCAADPYYWDYFVKKSVGNFSLYASPDTEQIDGSKMDQENVGTFFNACDKCKAKPICPGTYRTASDYFGDEMVKGYGDKR